MVLKLLKPAEIATMLGISLRQVWRLRDAGKLPAPVKVNRATRWREDDIANWILEGCPNMRAAREQLRKVSR